jgi:FAD/FMN-containing dehydrogenase
MAQPQIWNWSGPPWYWLADGSTTICNESENADLFWGIRGGGVNFRIVTHFEFQLHDVPECITAGMILYSLEDARAAISQIMDLHENASEKLTTWAILMQCTPLPFLMDEKYHHHKKVACVAIYYNGSRVGM